MSLAKGTRLGPYQIADQLGAGGMGEVYRATDTRLDRTVAIKVLPEHLASDPQRRERFEREARAVSSLNHPHICVLHDVGEQDGIHFLVMELVEGDTLAARLKKGRLPLAQALEYAIQIADALDKAHRQGVVHRDLKPGNIMITKSAGVKLLDFGLAKLKGDAGEVSPLSQMPTQDPSAPLTAEGTIIGTLQYMAPEQLEGKEADARTDIFAFGAVVYEMVTGKKAFEGASQASLIAAILDHDPQPMSKFEAVTPDLLDHVVKTCLAKDPDERWQAASDAMLELKWVARVGSEGNLVIAAATAPAGNRERIAWVGLAFVALIAVVSLALNLRPEPRAPEIRLDITTPPTTDPNSIAISPDGTQVVFVATSEGRALLWLRRFEATETRPLAGTEGASLPFWSPNNRSVGFFADEKLKRIDLDGGLVRELTSAPAGNGGSWNDDGVILFSPTISGSVYRIPSTGGEEAAVTRVGQGQSGHVGPHFLPGGTDFIYWAVGTPELRGAYVADLAGTLNRHLFDADARTVVYTLTGQLLFVRQETLFAQDFDTRTLELSGDPFPVADQQFGTIRAALSVSAAGPIAYRTGSVLPQQFLGLTGPVPRLTASAIPTWHHPKMLRWPPTVSALCYDVHSVRI